MTTTSQKPAAPDTTTPRGAPEPTAPVAAQYTIKDQDKYDAFRRLAGKRIAKLMDQFDILQNCANRAQYEYSPEQVEKIRDALQTRLDFLMNAFAPAAKHIGKTFEL